jgi:hypothetical protein
VGQSADSSDGETRVRNLKKEEGGNRAKARTTFPSLLLPNGRPDTLPARADLGHPDFPPDDHPSWAREDFKRRDDLMIEWQAGIQASKAVEGRLKLESLKADRDAASSKAMTPDELRSMLAALRNTGPV